MNDAFFQVMDTLQVERERGITVKAQTASMIFKDERDGTTYLVNLIDTPGHIDFSYEVSRSLASCQGALLLVDSSQRIQAQTLSNYEKAKHLGLKLIPVVTKIDLPAAQPEECALNMATTFEVDPEDCIMTSAKQNIGVLEVMQAVVDRLPSPVAASKQPDGPFYGRVVDSWFDECRGVVCLVQVIGGVLREGDKITTYASSKETKDIDNKSDFSVQEIGILTPKTLRTTSLRTGQVGYVIAGMRSTRQARIGDTMFIPEEWTGVAQVKAEALTGSKEIIPLSGYESAKQMLFASVFPVNSEDLESLFACVDRLCLNDSSISVMKDISASSSLGSGLRCGFLGFLHMEVFIQRLQNEFEMDVILTTPSVPYRVHYTESATVQTISNIADWPGPHAPSHSIEEPVVKVVVVTPSEYYGAVVEIIKAKRGEGINVFYLDDGSVKLESIVPWQEVVCDMSDAIKQKSAGYASLNYEEAGYQKADLVKVELAVNGEMCDPLSFISHKSIAATQGRKLAVKLKEVLSRQQFEIILQARIGSKILARERIAPFRKDVLDNGKGGVVGQGDVTRKKKLLAKQKEGKKRAKMMGKVEIGQEAFWAVLQR